MVATDAVRRRGKESWGDVEPNKTLERGESQGGEAHEPSTTQKAIF